MHIVEWLRHGLIVLLMLSAAPTWGGDKGTAIPRVTTRVTDVPGVIPEARKAALETKLEKLAKERGLHIGIVLVSTTQPESADVYGARVVDAWRSGVTGGKDGVLVLIAKDEGSIFLDVGRARAVMPYKEAMRLVMGVMAPHFQLGDYATGINAGIDALVSRIDAAEVPRNQESMTAESMSVLAGGDHLSGLALVLTAVVASVLGRLVGRLLAGAVGGGAVALLAWMLLPVLWVAIMGGVLAFVLVLSAPPGRSLRVLGSSVARSGGATGASGDWA